MAAERDRSREITAGVDIEAPDSEKPANALKRYRAAQARSAVVGLPLPLDDDGALGLLSAPTGQWPPQKSAAKLQPLRQSFAARILERFQERPECRKSQDLCGEPSSWKGNTGLKWLSEEHDALCLLKS
jgi:hypothetical protein